MYYNIDKFWIEDNTSDVLQDSELGKLIDTSESINDYNPPISKAIIPGDGKTYAYFPHSNVILDPESIEYASGGSNLYQWETYDEVKDKGLDNAYLDWRSDWRDIQDRDLGNDYYAWDSGAPDYYYAWPLAADSWTLFRDLWNPWQPCKIFSPVFTEEYVISGKVYFLYFPRVPDPSHAAGFSDTSVIISLRLRLALYNPATNTSTDITSYQETLPATGMWQEQRSNYAIIDEPVTIPVGYRLKFVVEYKYDKIPATGGIFMRAAAQAPGYSWYWNISDGVYSNSYHFYDYADMLGIQVYMRSNAFPDINLFGANNETVYQVAQNMTVDVTDGSISSYRWDGGTWNSFDNDTLTQLPATHGWHYLEVKASDPEFNNTRTSLYQIGYDSSVDNLFLNNAISGDYLDGGFVLNFTAYDAINVIYEWDADDNWITLNSPYDLVTPMFTGWHTLRINATDYHETISYTYLFSFDSDIPVISLINAVNDTQYAPGKYLEFLITDSSGLSSLNYSWDGGTLNGWIPDPSDTYSTYLPETGPHYLEIFASDLYGQFAYAYYSFFADDSFFSVDLLNLIEDAYYQGNNTVELNIQRSNETVYFKWDSDTEQLGVLDGTTLTLNGTNALPTVEGLHTLYIRTFNLTYHEQFYNFTFYVDNTAPSINNLENYDGGRWFQNTTFTIYIMDNFADNTTEIYVDYSLDGKIYRQLNYPFDFFYPYSDGPHTLIIRVRDLAGNVNSTEISFVIDSTAPEFTVKINGLVDRRTYDLNQYITTGNLFEISVDDIDLDITLEFNWNNTGWDLINGGNFTLPGPDGKGILLIRASDSLGNRGEYYEIELVYDNTPPSLENVFPVVRNVINGRTEIDFVIDDYTLENIQTVSYHWDLSGDFTVTSYPSGDFNVKLGSSLEYLYAVFYNYSLANLTFYTQDYLGNEETYIFNFTLDITPPSLSLVFNETGTIVLPDTEYPVQGGTVLAFNSTLNPVETDFKELLYYWEDTPIYDPNRLLSTGYITVPQVDGNHSLMIIIRDNTGDGDYPNEAVYNITFTVDDMFINYIYPVDFEDNYRTIMEYNDTFVYVVNITDAVDNGTIPGLNYEVDFDTTYNLTIDVLAISPSEYQVTIHATDVTNGLETYVEVDFYHPFGSQTISCLPTINKKEGNVVLLDIDDQIVYEEDLEIQFYLQNDLGENQTITKVFVNDSYSQIVEEITDFEFNNATYVCSFNYSSFRIEHKGNFSLDICTESSFYFANTTSIEETIDFEILPLSVNLAITVSNYTILEGTDVSINLLLTYVNGTPLPFTPVDIRIYIYLKNTTETTLKLQYENANGTEHFPLETDSLGRASMVFNLNSSVEYIIIQGMYSGSDTTDTVSFAVGEPIVTIPLPEAEEFPKWLLYTIIAGSVALAAIVSIIIYKFTRPKPFEVLMEKVTDEEIALNYSLISPGVVLTIFDQRKGPIPLIADHSFTIGRYIGRMRQGVDNFILKIADQAYSSLGFEEHDVGRRVGSIVLPTEQMIGFVHGIQLPNKMARGGFENLSLIVLADSETGKLLQNYQDYLYNDIDDLIKLLKEKKPLEEIKTQLEYIRKVSVIVMLAGQKVKVKD
jgi:hypothetical protein